MNRLSARQRKLVYLGGIVLLLIPIVWLGLPATGEENSGGELAQLRQRYDLGDSDLGKVDPSSATMNLVLLGLRGLAANQLWLQHDEHTKTKNWAQMRAVADSIITLQPHYVHVWRFHGWHLAFNVSAEWDLVEDRFYWVKEGGKFTMRGVGRNERASELPWEVGRILGHKMGRSDEWIFFRDFFKHDPDDEQFKDGPDPEIARSRRTGEVWPDNYLAAKEWFTLANAIEEQHGQHMMARPLFRHYPMRSQFDYAEALQRDARVAELPEETEDASWERLWSDSRQAWAQAYEEWTDDYGREDIRPSTGDFVIRLEVTPEERAKMTEEERRFVDIYQNMTNYRYWKARADLESQPTFAEARREIYEGERLFRKAEVEFVGDRPPKALALLQSGLTKFGSQLYDLADDIVSADPEGVSETALATAREIMSDTTLVEEALLAVVYLQQIYELNGKPIPADYPLKALWDANEHLIPEVRRNFVRETQLRAQ